MVTDYQIIALYSAGTAGTDKDHWLVMSYPFSPVRPIPTDPVGLKMLIVPLADKLVYYAMGMKRCRSRMLFSLFLAKFIVDVLKSPLRIFSLESLIKICCI